GLLMRLGNRTVLLFSLIIPGGLLPAAVAAGAGAASPYTPAGECAKCHPSIYKYWSESSHAKAVQSSLFPQALSRALELSSDATRTKKECVGCHSPTTLVTGDVEMTQAISRQGVSCDFCHTVKEVDLAAAGWPPFQLDPGPVKRGPFAYSKPFKGHAA